MEGKQWKCGMEKEIENPVHYDVDFGRTGTVSVSLSGCYGLGECIIVNRTNVSCKK